MVLAVPNTAAAPLVPDVINGFGTASTFEVFGTGLALEGGLTEWGEICALCLIRITVSDATFFSVVDADGGETTLTTGVYEFREFRGTFGFTQNAPHDFYVQVHGVGKINKLA